ncbi:MAG: hypothetical protein LBS96_05420 [Oscillospiraceae bacterium]|jgi:hypothetical protein|nr:hypothetical protein [Oscillospiraceae bacterium]
MSNPCLDEFFTTFTNLPDMMEYHAAQARESQWRRVPVNALRVLPLPETPPLFIDKTAFDPSVSEEAIADTAAHVGLAIRAGEEPCFPLRDTAWKSLLERAKINGTALPKLSREELTNVLNACLALFESEALLLIRSEKVAAVHSGDARDYAILPMDALFGHLESGLQARFPGAEFETGYSDHTMTSTSFLLPDQKDDLLQTYAKTLEANGQKALADALMPGIRFTTSDVGFSSAKLTALLHGLSLPFSIGSVVAVEHRWEKKPEEFGEAIGKVFAQFGDVIAKLEALLHIGLDYPVNAMTAVCKKLSLPKKAAVEAISMFEMTCGSTATAHDVFMALQEILFVLKTEHTPQAKLLAVEESLARALTLRWTDFDLAKAVSY